MKRFAATVMAVFLAGCAMNKDGTTSFGMIESKAWYDTASRKTIEGHFNEMQTHAPCIRWAETRSSIVRKEISGALIRRDMNPLLCY
jgi:hypothetical protein